MKRINFSVTQNLKFLILIGIVFSLFSCMTVKQLDTTKRYRTSDAFIYEFNITEKIIKVKRLKVDKEYYAFHRGAIVINMGSYSGFLLDGAYKKTMDNGKVLEQGEFDNGLKDGHWKYWNTSGQLIREENWLNGMMHGEFTSYDTKGNPSTAVYKRNQIQEHKK